MLKADVANGSVGVRPAIGTSQLAVNILAFALLFGVLWLISQQRLIDPDEGLYALTAKLVSQGQLPYLNFFWQNGPLLPFVYGFWIKQFGATYASTRMLSVLLTASAGFLVFLYVRRQTKSQAAAWVALALYISCGLIATWFTTVKTYGLTGALLVGCYVTLCWPPVRQGFARLALAGVLFGLACATRSYVIVLAPIFAAWIIVKGQSLSDAFLGLLRFGLGGTVGLAPSLVLFLASPDVFMFNNIGYHALITGSGLVGDWEQKTRTALHLMDFRKDDGIQVVMLGVVSFATFPYLRREGGAGLMALAIALALGLVSLLPTPTFIQYDSLCMPFLIVSATLGAFGYFAAADLSSAARRRLNLAAGAGIAAFALSAVPGLLFYLQACDQSPARIREVSKAIDRLAAPGEPVISFWPGFLVESQARVVPPFNNEYGWEAGWQLPPEARLKYKVGNPDEIGQLLATHPSRIVVVGNAIVFATTADKFKAALREAGYQSVATMGDTDVFVYDQ